MGTPDFAVKALEALAARHEVVCVYTREPQEAGRGKKLTKSPVHEFAEAHGILVRTPKTLRSAEAQAELKALQADISVVAAYGLILPQAVIEAFLWAASIFTALCCRGGAVRRRFSGRLKPETMKAALRL